MQLKKKKIAQLPDPPFPKFTYPPNPFPCNTSTAEPNQKAQIAVDEMAEKSLLLLSSSIRVYAASYWNAGSPCDSFVQQNVVEMELCHVVGSGLEKQAASTSCPLTKLSLGALSFHV